MSNYKSKEFVPSDSSSDEDENVKPKVKTPEASPVKEKKQKKEKKAKKNKEEVRYGLCVSSRNSQKKYFRKLKSQKRTRKKRK